MVSGCAVSWHSGSKESTAALGFRASSDSFLYGKEPWLIPTVHHIRAHKSVQYWIKSNIHAQYKRRTFGTWSHPVVLMVEWSFENSRGNHKSAGSLTLFIYWLSEKWNCLFLLFYCLIVWSCSWNVYKENSLWYMLYVQTFNVKQEVSYEKDQNWHYWLRHNCKQRAHSVLLEQSRCGDQILLRYHSPAGRCCGKKVRMRSAIKPWMLLNERHLISRITVMKKSPFRTWRWKPI